MLESYNTRTTIWSDRIEITKYKVPIRTGKKVGSKPRTPYELMTPAEQERSNMRRCSYYKKRIQELCALAIENDLRTFITLTFAKEVTEYAPAKHAWELFIKRLRYAFPELDLAYVAVHELQKNRATEGNDGVFHFHMLCNLGYCPVKKLEKIWSNGFVFIQQARRGETAQVLYLFKYVSKDLLTDEEKGIRTRYRKVYTSRNLRRPAVTKELTNETLDDLLFDHAENVKHLASYEVRNHNGIIINHANSVTIKK